jgi:hypothetical protein
MIIERVAPSGAWKITGVLEGESDHHFLTRVYYGYSKREAVRLWRRQVREEAGK